MAGQTALSAVHTALYAALQADSTLAGVGVYDHVPEDPTFPYLRLVCAEEPWDTQDQPGRLVSVLIHIFSTYRGMAEAYGLLDRVVESLRYEMLALSATDWVQVRRGLRYLSAAADEPELVDAIEVQHVLAEFDVLVQEAAGAGSP